MSAKYPQIPTSLFELQAHMVALERMIEFYTKLFQDENSQHFKDDYIRTRLDFLFAQFMLAQTQLTKLTNPT